MKTQFILGVAVFMLATGGVLLFEKPEKVIPETRPESVASGAKSPAEAPRCHHKERAGLGAIHAIADAETLEIGQSAVVRITITPRIASESSTLLLTVGPGLEIVEGLASESISLESNRVISRQVVVRRVADGASSLAVIVRGASPRRGLWSYTGGVNFFPSHAVSATDSVFTSAEGRALVGDR